jgi:hypothetical protein
MGNGEVLLADNGTLMRVLKLNPQMLAAKATFLREANTERTDRLWSINDEHPAMVRVTDGNGVRSRSKSGRCLRRGSRGFGSTSR